MRPALPCLLLALPACVAPEPPPPGVAPFVNDRCLRWGPPGPPPPLAVAPSGEVLRLGGVDLDLDAPPPGTLAQVARRGDRLAAASDEGCFERNGDGPWARVLEPPASGVAYTADGALWVATEHDLRRRDATGWTTLKGLPWIGGTRTLSSGPGGEVWLATDRGAVRWTPRSGFSYRQGPRWLPDDDVLQIRVDSWGTAWVATAGGVALLVPEELTLAEKARRLEAELERRHTRPPWGFVNEVRLDEPGDLSAWTQLDSDNDGLWTAMHGAGQCFAYAATGLEVHAERARRAFRALRFLGEVTQGGSHPAPPGFVARSVLPAEGPDPNLRDSPARDLRKRERDPLWKLLEPRWPLSADGRWYWKTDTSSDELDGHVFFYAQFYDLVADEAERAQVREVVTGIVDHLRAHGWRLVDHDGRPTRWANFAPESLNHDPAWEEERGLNSLSLLSYLAVAHHVSGDTRYLADSRRLIDEHGYAENVQTPKVHRGPGTGNQSDDEMAFMSFYDLLRYEQDPTLRAGYLQAFRGYWELERPEANPLFHFLFAGVAPPAELPAGWLEEPLETLRRFPLDRVAWSYQNSHRLDVARHAVEPGDDRRPRGARVIPIDERFLNRWNQDPWRLDGHGDGRTLADGTAYLLPYYLGRYLRLFRD